MDLQKMETARSNPKAMLVRRCNYLSERIVTFLKAGQNGDDAGTSKLPNKSGFGALNVTISVSQKTFIFFRE